MFPKSPCFRVGQVIAKEYHTTNAAAAHEEPSIVSTKQPATVTIAHVESYNWFVECDDFWNGKRRFDH